MPLALGGLATLDVTFGAGAFERVRLNFVTIGVGCTFDESADSVLAHFVDLTFGETILGRFAIHPEININ